MKNREQQQRCLYQFHLTICFPLVDAVRRNSAKRVASAIVYLGPVLAIIIIIVAVVVMTPINAIIMKIFSIIEFCYRFSNLSKLFLRGSALCFLHSPFALSLSMIYGLCALSLSVSLPPTLSLLLCLSDAFVFSFLEAAAASTLVNCLRQHQAQSHLGPEWATCLGFFLNETGH